MGICGSAPDIEGKRQNDVIESQLKREKEQQRTEVKMLLLGAGESGKSTILKQMKLIHEGGYNIQEKRAYKAIAYSNLIQSMKMMVNALDLLKVPLGDPTNNDKWVQVIKEASDQVSSESLPPPVVDALCNLWNDQGIKAVFKRAGSEYHLHDSTKYFMNDLGRLTASDYLPNDQDILRCRVKTTGITETIFNIGEMTYRMFDVGGQRSERKKWIHCFENVTAIVFLVAISEYDQKLVEDDSVNRMEEALTLFDSICNSRWFSRTSIILFLNKIDIFREKIYDVPIENYFPDYEDGDDADAACEYFRERFVSLNANEGKQVYSHYTCATDTNQIRFVMSAVADIIIRESLRQAGLV